MPTRDVTDLPIGFELRFLTSSRERVLDELTSGENAVQEAVVVNDDARPYSFDITTESKHPGLTYPDRSPSNAATFSGMASFNRRQNWRSTPLYEAVLYDGANRTQPESVEVAKSMIVAEASDSAGKSVDLTPHFVVCSPRQF